MKTKQEKRQEAVERQAEYDKLTIRQKIKRLDEQFGTGQGAEKQRLRLEKLKAEKKAEKAKKDKKKTEKK